MQTGNKHRTSKVRNNFAQMTNLGRNIYFSTMLFVSILFISSIFIGGITWDESGEIPVILRHFSVLFNNIPLNSIQDKAYLVYYGIIQLLPAYLLSLLFGSYHTWSHIITFSLSLLTSFYVYKILILFGLRRNIAYITAALLLIYPIWLGHSFFNNKDIPAAAFFTIYSYYVCRVIHSLLRDGALNRKLYIKLIIIGAILSGTRFAFFPIIIIDSLVITWVYTACVIPAHSNVCEVRIHKETSWLRNSKYITKLLFLIKTIILTLILTLILLPGAWHEPVTYMMNDLTLMSKFDWPGCTKLLNQCVTPHSEQWNAAKYLFSWYLAQTPLLFILLLTPGIIYLLNSFFNPTDLTKKMWLVLFVQLFFIPIYTMLHNSVLYDATRHTLFCLPILVIICGCGLDFFLTKNKNIFKIIVLCLFSLLAFGMVIDDVLLNPYQYSYYNEIFRYFVNDQNSETDYWGFSLRETYTSIDKNKYSTPYISMEGGPMPDTLIPYMTGLYQFVHYDKNMQIPPNVSVNVIGLVRRNEIDNRINPERCMLVSRTTRSLLFKPDELTMSKAYNCN